MRALRVLLVVAVVLAGLFIAADRVAVTLAENEAAQKIKSSQGVARSGDVSVDIRGFPFLTQVAAKDLDQVDATLNGLTATAGGRSLAVHRIHATFHRVRLGSDFSSAVADRANGTALISYGDLSEAAGAGKSKPLVLGSSAKLTGISYGGPGRVKIAIRVSTPMGGKTLTLPAALSMDGEAVRSKSEGAAWDKVEQLPLVGDRAEKWLRGVTDFKQRIGGLPNGLKLDRVEPTKEGVEFSVTGSDVELTG